MKNITIIYKSLPKDKINRNATCYVISYNDVTQVFFLALKNAKRVEWRIKTEER